MPAFNLSTTVRVSGIRTVHFTTLLIRSPLHFSRLPGAGVLAADTPQARQRLGGPCCRAAAAPQPGGPCPPLLPSRRCGGCSQRDRQRAPGSHCPERRVFGGGVHGARITVAPHRHGGPLAAHCGCGRALPGLGGQPGGRHPGQGCWVAVVRQVGTGWMQLDPCACTAAFKWTCVANAQCSWLMHHLLTCCPCPSRCCAPSCRRQAPSLPRRKAKRKATRPARAARRVAAAPAPAAAVARRSARCQHRAAPL